jgi:secreted PhoX family phosphatase
MVVLAALAAFAVGVVGSAVAALDFGLDTQKSLASHSKTLFGVGKPVAASSMASITQAAALADPTALVTLAGGLTATPVTTTGAGAAAPIIDMMALWPNSTDPEWLIACNEGGTGEPGLQRIDLDTGEATTILTGTTSCDGVRRTPWGTFLFSEEAGGGPSGGRVYELLDPINTTGVALDRATGTFSGGTGSENFAVRPFLGRLSFEGFAVYPNGVVYYGGEDRPSNGLIGGALFKFVAACATTAQGCPSSLSGATAADELAASPLAHGTVYGLRLGRRSGNTDFGQATETGLGTWQQMGSADTELDLRALSTTTTVLTGFYRPEDIDVDLKEFASGNVRWCVNNTGNEFQDHLWGESVCLSDGTFANAAVDVGANPEAAGHTAPELQTFVVGTPELAMPDNMAFQPGRGNWVLHEDGDGAELTPPRNNDLWDCLPDGGDFDRLSDGCIRIGTLNDLTAEWTGGIFDATGTRFFVSVQHNISGVGVVLEITGWR